MQNQWSFDFLSTSFDRKLPMCQAHSPRQGGELAKHRVERGIATRERRRKCSAFRVCCPSFLRERFVCSPPSDALADGSQTADLFGSASRRQCSVGGALSRRPCGTRSAHPSVLLSMEHSPRRRVLFLILRSASHGSLKTVDRFLQDRSVGKTD